MKHYTCSYSVLSVVCTITIRRDRQKGVIRAQAIGMLQTHPLAIQVYYNLNTLLVKGYEFCGRGKSEFIKTIEECLTRENKNTCLAVQNTTFISPTYMYIVRPCNFLSENANQNNKHDGKNYFHLLFVFSGLTYVLDFVLLASFDYVCWEMMWVGPRLQRTAFHHSAL